MIEIHFTNLASYLNSDCCNYVAFTFPPTTGCKKQIFSYLLSIFCQNLVSDQFLLPFCSTDSREVKMRDELPELVQPKCHLEHAKVSDLK